MRKSEIVRAAARLYLYGAGGLRSSSKSNRMIPLHINHDDATAGTLPRFGSMDGSRYVLRRNGLVEAGVPVESFARISGYAHSRLPVSSTRGEGGTDATPV